MVKSLTLGCLRQLVLAAPLLLVGACTQQPVVRSVSIVGPNPYSATGTLYVRTATTAHVDPVMQLQQHGVARLPFTVLSLPERHELITVEPKDERVPWLALDAGDYLVRATDVGGKTLEVPVRIEKGHETELFLDGSRYLERASSEFVTTGDGSLLGWRAQ